MTRRFPLHVHVSTLFLVLILVVGALLATVNHRMSRQVMTDVANDLTERISRETLAELNNLITPVETAVDLIQYSDLVQASSLEQRLKLLPLVRSALDSSVAVTSFYVGYPSGDFFLVRRLRTEAEMIRLRAPEGAEYVVQSIERRRQPVRGRYLYLDADAKPLRTDNRPEYPGSYDPRSRGWYQQASASSGTIVTPPYLFFSDREVGLTLAKTVARARGVVIGADIQLRTLGGILARQKVTPHTQVALTNAAGTVFAHEDSFQLVQFGVDGRQGPELATLTSFGVPILAAVGAEVDLAQVAREGRQHQVLRQDGASWQVAVSRVAVDKIAPLLLVMAIPDSELLANAQAQVRAASLVTLLIMLVSVPITWLLARGISQSLKQLVKEANAIGNFDFAAPVRLRSYVTEVNTLAETIGKMKRTIRRFLDISATISGERNFERLLPQLLQETVSVVEASAGVLYLRDGTGLSPACALTAGGQSLVGPALAGLHPLAFDAHSPAAQPNLAERCGPLLANALRSGQVQAALLGDEDWRVLGMAALFSADRPATATVAPLLNREGELTGAMVLLASAHSSREHVSFVGALSGTAAVALEAQTLIAQQKALFESFIQLIAQSIDTKSAYTGGHCAKVPELTRLLAQALCDSTTGPYQGYTLDDSGWETLRVASWLHDCGKITTPEHVVDKATKLELIYNRIHEVRMRFEVLKRDAEIAHLRRLGHGQPESASKAQLQAEWQALDEEFAFVAACNQGGEASSPEVRERLQRISARTWLRTLDDTLGLSQEEALRRKDRPQSTLPAVEPLLADQPWHHIDRQPRDMLPADPRWGFTMRMPALLYDQGELHNLTVERGTLTDEDRYKINEHIVQTEVMLTQLPFPPHLRRVPEIAAGHHEKLDGTGYPKGLDKSQLSLEARILAIADIFEALTAADRPYKKAKTLSEAVAIMARLRDQNHIDPDVFEVFLRQGVHLAYAHRFMAADLVDEVDVDAMLATRGAIADAQTNAPL
ncbi:MAG TPA: HD domain-containing phosphohydrolase [Burkholderiaceae bacterium]|nr:HD domain-containing phosphohydrolase [Burkholderiaceae bacterium]